MTKLKYLFVLLIAVGCTKKLSEQKKNELKDELLAMVTVDQIAANIPQGKYKDLSNEQWKNFKDSVYTSHKKRIEYIYKKYGYPGYEMVGESASNHFWLMVQHSDKYPDFQKKVLKAMDKEVKKNNANPQNYAYLFDRVQVNAGKKQMFGTQVGYDVQTTGQAKPKNGLIDSANVDKIRKDYKLDPLKGYLNMMTQMHYEMNKKSYQEKGIMEAKLYE
jgi:hypothetical protein